VVRRDDIFFADANPVSLVTTYIPWSIAQGTGLLEPYVPHPYGIHGVLADRGHKMLRMTDEVTSRMPSRDEVRRLRMQPGVPVIELLHTSLDQNLDPYEVTRFVMRADMNGLTYEVPVE
jgi:GntR family transcriptional regulator